MHAISHITLLSQLSQYPIADHVQTETLLNILVYVSAATWTVAGVCMITTHGVVLLASRIYHRRRLVIIEGNNHAGK